MSNQYIKKLELRENAAALQLFGNNSSNIKRIEKCLPVEIDTRGSLVIIRGIKDKVELAARIIEETYSLIEKGCYIDYTDIDHMVRILSDKSTHLTDIFLDTVLVSFKNKPITPKSLAQKKYVDAIRKYDIVFCIGPAGTGKTYLAIAMAVASLQKKEMERIILTRPAVEAGERLGFLPGDMAAKVDPYLTPLYDALHDMVSYDQLESLIEHNVIEVAPLAFMRGRTLNHSLVIMDEAQNATSDQMKMFLTRLGVNSRAIITGDITQIDLPSQKQSGLVAALDILKDVEEIKFISFTEKDVVRHPLVQDVIRAYEKAERRRGGEKTNHKKYE